jgi:hypothetical protein
MGGGAQVTDPAGGVLDGGEDVLTLSGQGDRLDEVDGQQRLGLAAQKVGPRNGRSLRRGVDAGGLEDFPDGRGSSLDPEGGEFAVDASVSPSRVSRARRRTRVRMERTAGGRPRRFGFDMFACRALIRLRW